MAQWLTEAEQLAQLHGRKGGRQASAGWVGNSTPPLEHHDSLWSPFRTILDMPLLPVREQSDVPPEGLHPEWLASGCSRRMWCWASKAPPLLRAQS